MLNEELQLYIQRLIPDRIELLKEMEEYASGHGVPIMEITGIEAMLQLLRLQKPKKILEVGTAIGYSALRMALTIPDARVITIERDEERSAIAERFFEKAKVESRVVLIKGDALEVEEQVKVHAPYDVIFIDAAKGQYRRFFELYAPYLSKDGMIVTDNVLFKGLVCEGDIENKRIRQLVQKIRDFNNWIMNHPEYDTVILPVGDGVAISRKR